MRSAMPSSVPSPPSTTTRSHALRQLVAATVGRRRRTPASARRLGLEDGLDVARARATPPARRDAGGRVEAALRDEADARMAVRRSRSCRRRCSKNSWLPFGAGDRRCRPSPTRSNPSALPRPAPRRATTRACTAGSRTMPPLPTSSRPASNCGFTSATTSAAGASSGGTTGRMWRSEMNDTSIVTMVEARASGAVDRQSACARSRAR